MKTLLTALVWAMGAGTPVDDPRLSPEQVVRTITNALSHNDTPLPNAGVFTAYRFASPANHAVTGPYGQFLRIVKTSDFTPMLGEHPTEFRAIDRNGDRASQVVRIWITQGKVVEYRWDLSLQQKEPHRGSWMVDGVSPMP
jgi:hypothetical protein